MDSEFRAGATSWLGDEDESDAGWLIDLQHVFEPHVEEALVGDDDKVELEEIVLQRLGSMTVSVGRRCLVGS